MICECPEMRAVSLGDPLTKLRRAGAVSACDSDVPCSCDDGPQPCGAHEPCDMYQLPCPSFEPCDCVGQSDPPPPPCDCVDQSNTPPCDCVDQSNTPPCDCVDQSDSTASSRTFFKLSN